MSQGKKTKTKQKQYYNKFNKDFIYFILFLNFIILYWTLKMIHIKKKKILKKDTAFSVRPSRNALFQSTPYTTAPIPFSGFISL